MMRNSKTVSAFPERKSFGGRFLKPPFEPALGVHREPKFREILGSDLRKVPLSRKRV